jgi:hypothetical protein
MGMVFADRSGVVWNQVDSVLSTETITAVRTRYGEVDVLFARYASQRFDFFDQPSSDFPFDVHRQNLESVLRVAPRAMVPGSAGFRFSDDLAWLNPHLFPISRARFVADVGKLDDRVQPLVMNPGDVIEVDTHRVRHLSRASDVAITESDDTDLLRFDPTAPIAELIDPNPAGATPEQLVHSVEDLVIRPLQKYLQQPRSAGDRVVGAYRALGATYRVETVLPGGGTPSYLFPLGAPNCEIVHRIAASVLVDWALHRCSFFLVRCWSRRYAVSYRLARGRADAVDLVPALLPDFLIHYMLNVGPKADTGAKLYIDYHVGLLRAQRDVGSLDAASP